jgi:methylated-DNA-[protein]-cysteine S-methyltransferase
MDKKDTLWTTTLESPLGPLRAFASARGLRALLLPDNDVDSYPLDPEPVERPDHPTFTRLAHQLGEYFAGARRQFDLPLDLVGTEFQRLAWDSLLTIPYGDTRSYSQQATAIDRPKAVRATGAANGRNPVSIVVPCHRVVGADGSMTGYAGGIDVKRFLLAHEQGRTRPENYERVGLSC